MTETVMILNGTLMACVTAIRYNLFHSNSLYFIHIVSLISFKIKHERSPSFFSLTSLSLKSPHLYIYETLSESSL